jgi:hypothetical protein
MDMQKINKDIDFSITYNNNIISMETTTSIDIETFNLPQDFLS